MEYHFRDIEKKWQKKWIADGVYRVPNDASKPKYYVLDMFPYPSGAGLHVGHPLGYIASDIYARYKRLKGFNVLHPMGYDAFGLPAEQYAIEHGVHPAESTEKNIATFRSQLDKIGFCYDWSREVKTSDPKYYRWTQWIFLQLFKSWYNRKSNKTEFIETLIRIFEKEGNLHHPIPNSQFQIPGYSHARFTADAWKNFPEKTRQIILMEYRIAYCGYGEVNWCEALGTVLANDEVVNGVSERGGYPVVKKKLRQWYLRITEYADRLLQGLETVEFSEAMKEMQGNWIGKSSGAEISFRLIPQPLLRPEKGPGDEAGHYYKTADKMTWPILKEFARTNRKKSTEAEDILWQRIRNNQLGVKVRRQHTISQYIADFVILEADLVIEVDGGYHQGDQKEIDEARDQYLNQLGLSVLRFTNDEVLRQTDQVIDKIKLIIEEKKKEKNTAPPRLRAEKGLGNEAELVVYTTRPDTIFGVDFMVLAPEHELVKQITSGEQKKAVEEYIAYVKSRSERERMAEKKISGVFTGGYVLHPFSDKKIPVWISEYVLAGYGTGAIMAVPSGDERDHKFARYFNLPITNIIGDAYNGEEANPTKDAVLTNSDFLNGMVMRKAIDVVIDKLEAMGIGKRKVNYKMRDAAFSRQRYWGEPFPIKWIDGIAIPLEEDELPLELPYVQSYKPGPEGEGPLANIPEWTSQHLETNTMPGYAGSSWYFLRYMDPHNEKEFCDKKWSDYWNQVDLYVGGTEHAVGHLLYSRMWTKCLYDLGLIGFDEPYRRLLNQGKIGGDSRLAYRVKGTNTFVSFGLKDQYETDELHVDVNIVNGNLLDIEAFRKWRPDFANAEFILEDGSIYEMEAANGSAYICGGRLEKMGKRYFNVVNPDDVVARYGADTFRMYEMFLGPIDQDKPWDTKGIEGVHRFIKKLWRLFFDEQKGAIVTNDKASPAELKILHRTIKKIEEDTERFSYNTAVSAFMVCVNELGDLKCNKKEILEPLLILLAAYAPHVSEELWHQLGHTTSIIDASFPVFNPAYLVETAKEYPVSVNGKLRTTINIDLTASQQQVEEVVLSNAIVQKWLEGKQARKIIYVKGKMVNVVV
ncbi:MAG: leucine--tRNA ligase [Flavisolibacter sp.]